MRGIIYRNEFGTTNSTKEFVSNIMWARLSNDRRSHSLPDYILSTSWKQRGRNIPKMSNSIYYVHAQASLCFTYYILHDTCTTRIDLNPMLKEKIFSVVSSCSKYNFTGTQINIEIFIQIFEFTILIRTISHIYLPGSFVIQRFLIYITY